jgi:hypothetical protein
MLGRRDYSSRDYQSDFGRDSSRSSEWSPSSDYSRHNEGGRSASRYGTSDSYRGQGRDLHYDEMGRGYGDSHRNPGDYDDRSQRYSGRNVDIDMERPEHLGGGRTQRYDRSNRSDRHDSYEVYGSRGDRSQRYGNSYESGRGFDAESRNYQSDDQGYGRENISRDFSGRYSQQDERVNRPNRNQNSDWSESDREQDFYSGSDRSGGRSRDRQY